VVPPRPVRRLVLAPAVVVLTVLTVTTLPLIAIVAAFLSPRLPGRWRPLRVLWVVVVALLLESAMLLACLGLWIASGFGWKLAEPRFQAAHEWLVREYLRALVRTARRALNLTFELEGLHEIRSDADDEGRAHVPVLVLARHAGPGDSILLVQGLTALRRHPRVVLKSTLQWAPALDVVLGRIPSQFVGPGDQRGAAIAGIARLAAGLGPDDGLVLFPEGGNFTEGRRVRSIAKLEESGEHARAERARSMRYVLSPRPGGVLAALGAAPSADVVFVAHTGLEDLSSIVDLWRGLPMDASIRVRTWRVPADEIPLDELGRISWLDGWWYRIDRWILERRGESAVPDALVERLIERETEEAERPKQPLADDPIGDGSAA
jgi:1-acyl-sn-glycerol-3-phosphate acyltransferase